MSDKSIIGESSLYKGDATPEGVSSMHITFAQSTEHPNDRDVLPTGNCWTCQQNNATNAYYVTLSTGAVSNNNKNNSYAVVRVADLKEKIDYLQAAEDCFENKKNRLEACRYHYNIGRIESLIKEVEGGTYSPSGGICFVLDKPKYREVFAANYRDRIVHHIVAPYLCAVADAVHATNGNRSHGNRHGYSAMTAARQIMQSMGEIPDGIVVSFDIRGFFMHIDRRKAYEAFCRYEELYKPAGHSEEYRGKIMHLIRVLVINDPSRNVERRSPISAWGYIEKGKSLFGNEGCGMPIGNFYSQIVANLYLAELDAALAGFRHTRFVDDNCCIVSSKKESKRVLEIAKSVLERLGLQLHPRKIYIQPVRHGVSFCGYVIFYDRMYIGNRILRSLKNVIRKACHNVTVENARMLARSWNSYSGFLCHCSSWRIQTVLAKRILAMHGEYLSFEVRKNQMVAHIRPEHQEKSISYNQLKSLKKYGKKLCKAYRGGL